MNMVKRYRVNLSRLRGMRFDSGYEDEFMRIPPTARALSSTLTNLALSTCLKSITVITAIDCGGVRGESRLRFYLTLGFC